MTLSRKAATCVNIGCGYLRLSVLLACVFLATVAAPPSAHAWSEAGHVMIAELALRQLPREQRQTANDIALALPDIPEKPLKARYGELSPMAMLGAWLDGQRGREVREIFASHGERLPAALKPYARENTDDWHYSNRLYFDGVDRTQPDRCAHLRRGELNAVLPRLATAFGEADADSDRALILAMLVHLVADAHQPLHSITRVTGDCDHDRGGNSFCVDRTASGRCKNNLHRLWDGGFGAFHQQSLDSTLQFLHDPADDIGQPNLDPEQWQDENFALADRVYSTPEGRRPSSGYRSWALNVVRERADLAAERLAALLTQLLQQESR